MKPVPRVVITGLGVVCPAGETVPDFAENIFSGKSVLGRIDFEREDGKVNYPGAVIKDFAPEKIIDSKKLGFMDRFSQFAVIAARQAMNDAGLTLTPDEALRCATIIGSGVGGHQTLEDSYNRLRDRAGGRVHPFTIPRLMINAAASHISMDRGLTGPAFTVASACASATHAIGVAMQMVRSGAVDYAVTGGTEACMTFGTLKGWEALRVMAPDVCRPFSQGRQGMVMGEGCGILMLETLERAQARGAKIYAELAGFGQSADACDLTTPDAGGMARAMQNALDDAGLKAEDIGHINAHGTGTRANDLTETKALNAVFGAHTGQLAVTANKSLFGHALGAAGALEMVALALAMQAQRVPPTAHFTAADPECALDIVTGEARAMPLRAALKNSFAFGGLNAVLAVTQHGGA
ncbi:MAG: beta-ketoacyl-ACP synthase II [Alphaproteobacteria bacterium]|nr:beta-ketoacyl-ACP synthase II [Alphaproteobacteria bacterium]